MTKVLDIETLSFITGLEHDNAILETRLDKCLQKIRTLRDVNEELKKKLDECKKLWGVRV